MKQVQASIPEANNIWFRIILSLGSCELQYNCGFSQFGYIYFSSNIHKQLIKFIFCKFRIIIIKFLDQHTGCLALVLLCSYIVHKEMHILRFLAFESPVSSRRLDVISSSSVYQWADAFHWVVFYYWLVLFLCSLSINFNTFYHQHWFPFFSCDQLVSSRGYGLPGCWCALVAFQWVRLISSFKGYLVFNCSFTFLYFCLVGLTYRTYFRRADFSSFCNAFYLHEACSAPMIQQSLNLGD